MDELKEFYNKLLKELSILEESIDTLKHNKELTQEQYDKTLNILKQKEVKLKELETLKKELPLEKHPKIVFITGIITTIITIILYYVFITTQLLNLITKPIYVYILSILVGIPIITIADINLTTFIVKKIKKFSSNKIINSKNYQDILNQIKDLQKDIEQIKKELIDLNKQNIDALTKYEHQKTEIIVKRTLINYIDFSINKNNQPNIPKNKPKPYTRKKEKQENN